jgi:hypothetical protein
MRPSSPTGLGRIEHGLVFLLPGNPVSCLCAYDFFAGRAIRALGGRTKTWPYRPTRATLTRKLSSTIGRLDYARVRVIEGAVEPLAIGGASVLSSTTRADGFVIVSADSEGFAAGADVEVWLYARAGAVSRCARPRRAGAVVSCGHRPCTSRIKRRQLEGPSAGLAPTSSRSWMCRRSIARPWTASPSLPKDTFDAARKFLVACGSTKK